MKKLLVITCFLLGGLCFAQKQQTSPVWPGCENAKNVKKCFNQKLSQHVRKTYVYPQNADGEYERGKVTVTFTVEKNGEVVVNEVKGKNPAVNEAAKKMLQKIPKMKPGTLKGEPDDREFTLSFNF